MFLTPFHSVFVTKNRLIEFLIKKTGVMGLAKIGNAILSNRVIHDKRLMLLVLGLVLVHKMRTRWREFAFVQVLILLAR